MKAIVSKPLFISGLLAGCASGGVYSGANRAIQTFSEIEACAKGLSEAQFEKQCRYEFKDVRRANRVDAGKMLGGNYGSVFGEAGGPKRRVHCQIKNNSKRLQAEKLKAQSIVEIVGTPSEVAADGEVTFIVFDECELKSL
jgi:hypothetical protein